MSQELPVTGYALLGLLTFGDALTGYELKQRADITLRFYWTSPAMSQVYSELARLDELGLVRGRDGDGSRPTTVYRITAKGERWLKSWLESTEAGFPVLKHPVALRLLLGHLVDPEHTISLIERYLADLAQSRVDLEAVREMLRDEDGPGERMEHPSMVADWGLAHYASEQRIARDLLDRLTK